MRFSDCDLDGIASVSMSPIERDSPEEEWLIAKDSGAIPGSIYRLYVKAHFFSFGAAPRFLSDPDNRLFSYFGLVVRSVQSALSDARYEAGAFSKAQELVYDPDKLRRGVPWQKDADSRARRHFRDLLISLHTALDSLADTIAIFFPGQIRNLTVGRAQFSAIEKWLQEPEVQPATLVTPQAYYSQALRAAIAPVVNADPPEKDWLPLMRLLRNKSAHLGQPLFRTVGLPRRGDGRFFVFIPRTWPYLWESSIKRAGERTKPPEPLPELLDRTLVHQDILAYSAGLLRKVFVLVERAFEVLCEAYDNVQALPENTPALAELEGNFQRYQFEEFIE